MNINTDYIDSLLSLAASQDRTVLYEHEVYQILRKAGVSVPQFVFLAAGENTAKHLVSFLQDKRFVMKVVSEFITHKTEAGGVSVDLLMREIPAALAHMQETVPTRYADWLTGHVDHVPAHYNQCINDRNALEKQIASDIRGFLVVEEIEYPHIFGGEFIVGAKQDAAFGPVIMFGPGGTGGEFYSNVLKPDEAFALLPATEQDRETIDRLITPLAISKALSGRDKRRTLQIPHDEIIRMIRIFQTISYHFSIHNPAARWHIHEFEANPCVYSGGNVYTLDGFLRFGPAKQLPPRRPLSKIKRLLDPKSVGLIGISAAKTTPLGTVLRNLLNSGISTENVFIVHPQEHEIQGFRCYPSLEDLKNRLKSTKTDLFIVGVPSAGPPGHSAVDVLRFIIRNNLSEAILVISAGFDETEHGKEADEHVQKELLASRSSPDTGPVICGPNTLGNIYGMKDTRFTPRYKSCATGSGVRNTALISQSGALMICTLSNLAGSVNPAISISVGNQIDLTFSDYLTFIKNRRGIDVFGLYVEGFKEGDGAVFSKVVSKIVKKGKAVIVYKAGKTPEGRDATKGHTASVAGDYITARRLLQEAGAYVADSFAEFEDMLKLFALLTNTKVKPRERLPRVAALSNSGFERCAIADNLYADSLQLLTTADYTPTTQKKVRKIFHAYGLDRLADIGRILDLTPTADDSVYKQIVKTLISDKNADCCLVSIVPETAMLQTLKCNTEDFSSANAIASHLINIRKRTKKPIVVSVASGTLYDPVVKYLEEHSIPTFRKADTATLRLGRYMQYRILHGI